MQLKNYILRWSDNYQLIFQKSRLLSQIPIFIFAIMVLCEMILSFIHPHSDGQEQVNWKEVIKYTSFLLIIFLPLSIRFLLLFSKSRKSFWLSQFFWLISFSWFTFRFNELSHGGWLRGDEALVLFYLIGSTFRQFVTLAVSFIPERKF